MAHRINTRNFENGMDSRLETADWKKYISRHCQFWSKAEMMDAFGNDPAAKKAIEAKFSPFLLGEHLYYNLPDGQSQVCVGYVDEQSERGYYMIQLASEFGEDCEVCRGKKAACERLFEIYQQATAA
jgi:hypothetical protein